MPTSASGITFASAEVRRRLNQRGHGLGWRARQDAVPEIEDAVPAAGRALHGLEQVAGALADHAGVAQQQDRVDVSLQQMTRVQLARVLPLGAPVEREAGD